MSQIYKSTKPCCLCRSTEKTVEAKLPELQGVVCLDCLYERLEEKPAKNTKKKVSHASSEAGG